MKVAVFGYKGWIGSMMCNLLQKDNISILKPNIHANDIEKVEKFIIENKPTHIMSFIGRTHGSIGEKKYTNIDYLEQPGKLDENMKDNLFSPIVLAQLM